MRNIASVFRRLQLQRASITLILGAFLFVSTAYCQPYSTQVSRLTADRMPSYPVFGLEKGKEEIPAHEPRQGQANEPQAFHQKQNYSALDEESKTRENQTQKNLNEDNSRVDYGERVIRSVSNRQ